MEDDEIGPDYDIDFDPKQLFNNCSTVDSTGRRVFDLKYTKQLAKTYFQRSKTSVTEEARNNNYRKYKAFRLALEEFGYEFEEQEHDLIVLEP